MKILHVVGWYPSAQTPSRALFIKRHIEALESHAQNEIWHIETRIGDKFRLWTAGKYVERRFEVEIPIKLYRLTEWISTALLAFCWITCAHRQSFDIINFHIAYPNLVSRPWRWLMKGKPIAITEHWSAYHFSFNCSGIGLTRTRRIFRDGVPVLAVSDALIGDIETFAGSNLKHKATVPNIVPKSPFFYDPMVGAEEGRFLFVGNLTFPKRPDVLIRAIQMVNRLCQSARLVIVGDGPERQNLEALDLSGGQIEFLGRRTPSEIAVEMRRSHALLHCSGYETFGVVCAEALCCGTPVLASKVGGLVEVLSAAGEGASITSFDPETWADEIVRRWDTCLYSSRIARSERAQKLFSSSTVGLAYLHFLKELSSERLNENRF